MGETLGCFIKDFVSKGFKGCKVFSTQHGRMICKSTRLHSTWKKHMPYLCLVMLDKVARENMSKVSKCQLRQRHMPIAANQWSDKLNWDLPTLNHFGATLWAGIFHVIPMISCVRSCTTSSVARNGLRAQRLWICVFLPWEKEMSKFISRGKCHVNSVQNWCVNHNV